MFESEILSQLTKEELHRPLRAREVVGAVLFMLSFTGPAAIIFAIQVKWLQIVAIAVWVFAVPFYARAVIGRWRASRERGGHDRGHAT